MLYTRSQVREIVHPHPISLIRMVQSPGTFKDKIYFFLMVIERGLAISAGIDVKFPEPGDRSQGPILWVAVAKDWLVATRARASFCFAQARNVSMQPRRVDGPLLSQEPGRNQQGDEESFQLFGPRGRDSTALSAQRRWYTTEYA
jgi:hypothetical protein